MRILLAAVNAKYIHSNPALYLLRESAAQYRERIEICEFTINQYTEEIVSTIYRKKPDFLAFSCYIWNIGIVLEAAQVLRRVLPDVPIWLGGPEVSFEGREFLEENPFLTGVMQGEGEVIFRRLLDVYGGVGQMPRAEEAAELSRIPGLLFRCGTGEIVKTRQQTMDDLLPMDEVPFIYGTDPSSLPEAFRNRIIYYEASRGCPFSCTYCLSCREKLRVRSLSQVEEHLAFFLEAKVPQVKFLDRTFNLMEERTLEILRFLKENDNGITNFHFEVEGNELTQAQAELLSTFRKGYVQLEIGVQSANPETLRSVHRRPELGVIGERVRFLRKRGNIHLHLDLIAGLPGEGMESFRRSFNTVYLLRPHELQLGFLKLLKGTPLREEARERGILFHDRAPYEVLATPDLSFDEILRLKDVEEMLELYYNSGQFSCTVRYLEQFFGGGTDPFSLYEALAVWQEEQGLRGLARTRYDRLEMIRNFGRTLEREKGSCCREVLPGAADNNLPEAEGAAAVLLGGAMAKTPEPGLAAEEAPDAGSFTKEQPAGGADGQIGEDILEIPVTLDECLAMDLYLRENAKSRPAWLPDLQQYKEEIRAFYRKEAAEHRYLTGYEGCDAKQLQRMTHLEFFASRTLWVLFDYSERDPVTSDCRAELIKRVENRQ